MLTSPNINSITAKKAKQNFKINLKKKPKNLSNLDSFNESSSIGHSSYYPYHNFHNKCSSLLERDKGNPVILKDTRQDESHNKNLSTIPKCNLIQNNNTYLFLDKRSNSNSTNVTSIKDQLSDYNDLSLMLGSRLNFKYKTKFNNISNILNKEQSSLKKESLKKVIADKVSKKKIKLKKCLSNEIKKDNSNSDDLSLSKIESKDKMIPKKSTKKEDKSKGKLSETDSDCNNEIIKQYFQNSHSKDSSVVNSFSSKDEIDNDLILAEPHTIKTLSLLPIKKARNKMFSKQLSRISEISLKQSQNNDSISNIELNSQLLVENNRTINTERSQNLHLKNKLRNINNILTNQGIPEIENKSKHKRPLSLKSNSKSKLILKEENERTIHKRSENNVIGKKNHLYSMTYEFSSIYASSSSQSSDAGFLPRSNTKSYNDNNTFYSIFSPSNILKRKKSSKKSIGFDTTFRHSIMNQMITEENESLIKKQEKLLDKLTPEFNEEKEDELLRAKDYFINKSINSVTKYLADIIDFDPENSVFDRDEIGTKSYFKRIKHSKVKSKEDVFIYYFCLSYNFFKKDNKYKTVRTVTPTSEIEKDRSDCIYIRNNKMCQGMNSYLLEKDLQVSSEINQYLLSSNPFSREVRRHHRPSLFMNFAIESKHKSVKEKLKEMQIQLSLKILERDRTVLLNPLNILQNSVYMFRDITFTDKAPIIIKDLFKPKTNSCTVKSKKNKIAMLISNKKKNDYKISETSLCMEKYNDNDFKKKITKLLSERTKSTLETGSESPCNHFLTRQNEYFQLHNMQAAKKYPLTTQYNKSDIPQKESVLLRTHEIKNDIINNFNSVEECVIFHIKDGNYHNFLELMTKYKIDPETRDYKGNTLMILAVNSNSIDIVDYLVKRDFNVNGINHNYNTPLHYAISHRNYEMVDFLIKNGADENVKNSDGISPWQCLKNGITLN